jgi:hypothetical protein
LFASKVIKHDAEWEDRQREDESSIEGVTISHLPPPKCLFNILPSIGFGGPFYTTDEKSELLWKRRQW